jgi:hypothetical protein
MDDTSVYANLLYANLLSASPKATFNMANNITLEELEDRYVITIAKGVPYARYTTENWGRRSARSKAQYEKKRLHKEKDNYRWVERTIEQTFASMFGKESVTNEL